MHECLITKDEARMTAECLNHYVINPAKPLTLVNDEFCYTSDGNKDWLSIEQLKAML